MGLTKRLLYDSHGFDSVEKFVCGKCVSDRFLARLVADNLASDSCSYCNAHGMIAAPFATVMGHIYDTVLHYYGDAEDVGVPVDGDGRGWALSDGDPIDILPELDTEWSHDTERQHVWIMESRAPAASVKGGRKEGTA